MSAKSKLDRAHFKRNALPYFTVVAIILCLLASILISRHSANNNVVRPAPADVPGMIDVSGNMDHDTIDPGLDLRFEDPIIRLVHGERLLTISGTIKDIPPDCAEARIGYRLSDGRIIEAMGSSQPTAKVDNGTRQISFDGHYDLSRQYDIPDGLTVVEPLVLLYNGDKFIVVSVGTMIDASTL